MSAARDDSDGDTRAKPAKRTPLPKLQLSIVFLIQLAEALTASVIYPFVNQFVRDTDVTRGDESKTGYYAGIIESAFFFAEAFTVFHWGCASDKFGRRPILLLGPLASRCLQGAFNANIGVSKSVIGEITDSTNLAEVYAMMPLMWSFGATIGPIIGGLLAQPANTWPDLFGNFFFCKHPYFLPCAVASLVAFIPALIGFIGLKEVINTLPSAVLKEKKRKAAAAASIDANAKTALLNHSGHVCAKYGCTDVPSVEGGVVEELPDEVPLPLKGLLTHKVFSTLLVHCSLCFLDMSSLVLQPLIYSTSISLGGLGFSPYRIGVVMGIWGVLNAILQFTCLGLVLRTLGARKLQIISQLSYAVVFALYPLLTYFAIRAGRVDGMVWTGSIRIPGWKCANYFLLSLNTDFDYGELTEQGLSGLD
ncbi:hypothetical protein H0H81_011737 [Sphagnurus paluster]|uniref:Major facilitator superfamily (MFS) profile domain-containing protein n=1 Tax=Sphagnurus paluster TaxID=117069 RepID=A0A9P7GUG0_9AGAR|nr:hypothetical protein H0H81_011737 [Sphagnurus paluster]